MSVPLTGAGLAIDGPSGPTDGLLWATVTDFLIWDTAADYLIWQ